MMLRRSIVLLVAAGTAGALLAGPAAAVATADTGTVLVPIGGGYEADTEQQFVQVAAEHASGPTVDILVVPSSYGDAPEDREENLQQAQLRTDELDENCELAIDRSKFSGCTATLLVLLNRADADDPANSAAFDDPAVDAAFVLGGDQVLAMRVLANSPAEAAMTRAHDRGVVFSGTSAGNAVESRSMITGYSPEGQPWTGLQHDAATIGWGDTTDTDDRGLAFGSQRAILDQHFYQRGRFGRLLNLTAQSVDRYGPGGKLGIGVDYATAPVLRDDRRLTDVIGQSSVAVLDFDAASPPQWIGPDATLSTRRVLTHLIAPQTGVSYDTENRELAVNGDPVAGPTPRPLPSLRAPGRTTVLLGGGGNDSGESPVLQTFINGTKGSGIVVAMAGYDDDEQAQAAGDDYAAALVAAGWSGSVKVLVRGRDRIDAAAVRGAAGVVFVGGDQSLMPAAVADRRFGEALRIAVRSAGVVLTDGAMTAAMASRYAAVASPGSDNYEDEAIRYFRGDARVPERGFGVVAAVTLEPWLTYNYRWGVLFGNASLEPSVAVGISEQTAVSLQGTEPTVIGARSVITVDGRDAEFDVAPNGAITAVNTFLSTFAVGDRVR